MSKLSTKPLILLNFKLYPETIGKKGIELAKKLATVKSKKYNIGIAPATSILSETIKETSLPIFAQHTDPVTEGAFTGHISPEELRLLGVKGTILNHSERKITIQQLKKTVLLCKKNKLITIICASNLNEIKKIAKLHPDYLAYEPRELIGGTISVTNAKPEIIQSAVELLKKISPKTGILCGAGVHSQKDLQRALQLGAKGVLIGHAIPKAKNPVQKLKNLLS